MFSAILLSSALFISQQPLTLSELVEISLTNNPETSSAWWKVKRATSCVDASKSAYYPTIDLSLGAAHGKEYEFVNGPNRRFTQTSAELSLSMLLFDFGERSADVQARKNALMAACWEQDFCLQKVMIETLDLAYKVLHAQETLMAAEITRDDAKKMLDYAVDLEKAGFAPISDVYTSKAAYSEALMQYEECLSEVAIQKGNLASQLGFSADTPFSLLPQSKLTPPKKEDIQTLINRAKEQRKDLMAQAARLQESMQELAKTNSSFLPKLTFGATGGLTHYNHDHHQHTKNGNYTFSLTLDVPLFSGLDSIYNRRVAYADSQTSLAELKKLELDIAQEVLAANKSHEAAANMLVFAADTKENAYQAYAAALEKYRAGKENMFQEVSSALRMLAQARVRYSEVKTSWLTTLARLAYATGTLAVPQENL